jgi:uncharacterized protein (TIGR02466 family)
MIALHRCADVDKESAAVLAQRGMALRKLGRLDEAAEAVRDAIVREPRAYAAVDTLVRILSSQRDWHGLLQFAQDQSDRQSVTTSVVLGQIFGLIGLRRIGEAARLLDFDTFVRIKTIDPPAGYRNLAEFNAALTADVISPSKIRLSGVPRIRLTGGVQVEDLEMNSSPAMASLMSVLRSAVEEYVRDAEGLRTKIIEQLVPPVVNLDAWALLLGADDAQDSHVHLNSSVAGVYYVSAPADLLEHENNDGCLVIPCEHSGKEITPAHFIKPEPGRLVLFPGYFPHRTTPTRRDGQRISIAFDVTPVKER